MSLLSGVLLLASATQVFATDRSGPVPAKKPAPPAVASAAPVGAPAKTAENLAATGQCAWLGKRILLLLARDDVVAAGDFSRFYVGFGCPEDHLGKAFGCLVAFEAPLVDLRKALDGQASPEARKAAENAVTEAKKTMSQRADQCWADPGAAPPERKEAQAAPAPAPAQGNPPAPAQAAPPAATPVPAHPAPAAGAAKEARP